MKLRLYRLAGLMPVVALAAALHGSPVVAQTTDPVQAWPPAASVPALQERMKSIRAETDPERRMALMEEQIGIGTLPFQHQHISYMEPRPTIPFVGAQRRNQYYPR